MTNNQITITHHPATDTAPQHWRSSDGAKSPDGFRWFTAGFIELNEREANPYRAAFFTQILNAEPEPGRAKIEAGMWVTHPIANDGEPFKVLRVHSGEVWFTGKDGTELWVLGLACTIVDPPERLTAKGSEITQKDGVWEFREGFSWIRFLVQRGRVMCSVCNIGIWNDCNRAPYGDIAYTHISDDPRDLMDW